MLSDSNSVSFSKLDKDKTVLFCLPLSLFFWEELGVALRMLWDPDPDLLRERPWNLSVRTGLEFKRQPKV